ncbi:MAG TPA: CmcI family methyltransferase [Candidatus Acidoferrum sp.]|jgi:cephalosporin hydroxylase|nr:CmcI family methyltransferase [Candidatus Acidoferrum sp.]
MKWLPPKIGTLLGLGQVPGVEPGSPQPPQRAAADQKRPVFEPAAAAEEAQIRRCLEAGRRAEALKLARRLVGRDSRRPGAHFLLATCLDRIGRYEEALESYRAELSLNPNQQAARARCEQLEASLVRPTVSKVPPDERNWRSSLPRTLLLTVQRAHLHYRYRDVPLIKNPFDLALYQRLLWELKPLTIIEVGSKHGGSALWMADLLNNFGIEGHIYSVDIVKVEAVSHPRVTFLEGDGRALGDTLRREFLESLPRPWLVVEDADHEYETSSAVLSFFHPWLRPGEYIVVEDGILSDLLEDPQCNCGPHRALKEFLARHRRDYDIDSGYCDYFGHNVTWCTNGFLKKVTASDSAEDEEFRELLAVVQPYTMLGPERLFSLFRLAKEVCLRDLPGNFVECGVAAGGSSALLAAVVARHSRRPRKLFACDSFAGLPAPGPLDRHESQPAAALGWTAGTCASPVDSLLEVSARLGVSQIVEPVCGFFVETLPTARERIGEVVFLHLDGDWYESTRVALENLYAQVVPGGLIQIDDYGYWEGCGRAVADFQRDHGQRFELNRIDTTGVWLRKPHGHALKPSE